jgi:uncharacterized membrane protein
LKREGKDRTVVEGRHVPPYSIRRVGNLLHRIVPVKDSAGKVIQHLAKPLMVELRPRDLAQILAGAALLSVPVGFTEEAWRLGEQLSTSRVVLFGLISMLLIALYVYFTFYRVLFPQFKFEYVKRVVAIYAISLLVVAGLLTLIGVAPWASDSLLAVKRVIIVALPASMSAALSDSMG